MKSKILPNTNKLRIGIITIKLFLSNFYRYLLILFIFCIFSSGCNVIQKADKKLPVFDGHRAFDDIIFQLELGPRIPGSRSHQLTQNWISNELVQNQWNVELQNIEIQGKTITNIIAKRGLESRYILLGAHYDTRIYADQDPNPDLRLEPVPGANDGASGVALLLEIARVLPLDLPVSVQIAFFDAEDNGDIEDWDWIMGSKEYVKQLKNPPEAVIIVDMIGDADLTLYREQTSNKDLLDEIWAQAYLLGYDEIFLSEEKYAILDDHTPFLDAGIPAVDIIDIEYPYWHTTEDTEDKVSPESLKIVGNTILNWLLSIE
jgi:Zn-dependent M28 family amino/carboxypeptidase